MPAPALTTRRDFLRGQPLATGLPSMEDPTTPNSLGTTLGHDSIPPRSSLVCASRRAMGCCFELLLPTTTPAAFQACNAALDTIDRLEDQLTVYQDTSEVSRINRMASFTPVPVEPRLFELLETARRLTKSTEGAFDVAAGALVRAWGFLRGPKRVPPPDELAAALHQVGSQHVRLDRNRQTIAFLEPGVELNLGAIGKGYALDRAGEVLRTEWGVSSGLLHGGRSSVLAIGSTPLDPGAGWLVALTHPCDPARTIAVLKLRDAALGTSGTTYQYFEADGKRWGHVLDPRTGWPVDSRSSVSVIAPTAAVADALSTAFFILGPERARDYCQSHSELGAVVATVHGEPERLEISLFGRAIGLVETAENHETPESSKAQSATPNQLRRVRESEVSYHV